MEVFNDRHRFLLLTGPRKSSKTIAALNRIMRHVYDCPVPARVAMFGKTVKNMKAGGVWVDLTQIVLPEWLRANIGMSMVTEPSVTGDTRMSYFQVTNRYGGVAEVQLHSLEFCPDIVDKIKGGRFSLIYFSEADVFEDRIVFDISEDQLRMIGLDYSEHFWIADCNPPDTGPNHWLHDLFFKEKDKPDHQDPDYQAQIHRIEFTLDDNPFLDEREKKNLIAKYRHRKSLYDRFILGKWEEDLTDGFFSDVFREAEHVMGSIQHPQRVDWEVITPSSGCFHLFLGIDPGHKNHSAHIVEKINTPTGFPVFSVLDEIISVDRNVSIREFTEAIVRQMDFWENYCKVRYNRKIKWTTYADNSIFEYRAAAEANEELIMRNVSNGRIQAIATRKFAGSVMKRKDILHILLWEKRIFFSASCQDTISMLKALKPGTSKLEPVARTRHKHPFDSLTYILLAEEPLALERNAPKLDTGASARVVMVG